MRVNVGFLLLKPDKGCVHSKWTTSKNGKCKETTEFSSRQRKKKNLFESLKCLNMYFRVYLNIHKYLVRKEEKCFSFWKRRKRRLRCMLSSLMLRKAIQAIHVFPGKGAYFILKGTAKSLRCITPEKTFQFFFLLNVWHYVDRMENLIIIRMFYKL